MESIRIENSSVSCFVRSYLCADVNGELQVIWLELAPYHPKSVGAIWASLVNNTKERLTISHYDRETRQSSKRLVRGLHRRYERFSIDAPQLAGRPRPHFLRLVAPEAINVMDVSLPFVVLSWQGQTAGQSLAAMLERGSPFPLTAAWGDYLLQEGQVRGCINPLVSGGSAPEGYYVAMNTPWAELIQDGIRAGQIAL